MLLANLAFISLRVLHRIHIQFAVLQRFETLSAQALSMGFPRGWPLESMCYVQALRMLMRNLVLALPPAAQETQSTFLCQHTFYRFGPIA